jgi:hypothetical protein
VSIIRSLAKIKTLFQKRWEWEKKNKKPILKVITEEAITHLNTKMRKRRS